MKNELIINGEVWVKKENQLATSFEGMPYQIVRASSAGVFAGYVEKRTGQEVVMRKVRRIWFWSGAASLSQMAVDGVSHPEKCKFSVVVDREEIFEVIEILDCTQKAKKSIEEVFEWKQ